MNRFNKWLEDLSKNPMLLVIWVLIIIISIFGLYFLIKFIKEKIDEYLATSDYKVVSSNLSYTTSEYKAMADQLYNAMNGAGTDETVIYDVLNRLNTVDDYNQLVKTFGTRSASSFVTSFSGTLQTWLRDELDDSEVKKVNNILSKMGVSI